MLEPWWPLLVGLLSATSSALVVRQLVHSGGTRWLDTPNERSLHSVPKPRSGGLGILTGTLAGVAALLFIANDGIDFAILFSLALPIIGVAIVDDLKGLGIIGRLLAQLLAAALCIAWLFAEVPDGAGRWSGFTVLLFLIGVVWMTNLYNFMDGMDGLAASMALIGFSTLAVLGLNAGQLGYAIWCAALAGAALGFMAFNWPPSRIFMGDSGSTPLGFWCAATVLLGVQLDVVALGLGLVLFSPFIVDASLTLTCRALRAERFWRPHRSHYYQRLVQSGLGHGLTLKLEIGLILICAGIVIWAQIAGPEFAWPVVAATAVAYIGLIVVVERYLRVRLQHRSVDRVDTRQI